MSTDVLDRVAGLVERESGIVLGRAHFGSLQAAIGRVAPGMTAERLLAPPVAAETLDRLIDEITVRETYFFRHRTELDGIDWHAAVQTARARGADAVRVWVAGCASGEEAYTIAILACEALGSSTPAVRILATDIAPSAVAQARRGRYGARAVRTLRDDVRRRYFNDENGTLCVGKGLRELVEVRRHNLVRDMIPPPGSAPFDLILCRNVLIYFSQESVDRVLALLRGALWPDGRLLLGAADRISGRQRQWEVPRGPGMPGLRRQRPPTPSPSGPRRTPPRRAAPGADRDLVRGRVSNVVAANADARLSHALRAADSGDLDTALKIAGAALAQDPLDSEAHYITGVVELARAAPRTAVDSLRRALYADPSFSLAAFQLARAHDALGERGPARRAYEQALRIVDQDPQERSVAEMRDLVDITAACRARLGALAGAEPSS